MACKVGKRPRCFSCAPRYSDCPINWPTCAPAGRETARRPGLSPGTFYVSIGVIIIINCYIITGLGLMLNARKRSKWRCLGNAYVQQWTSFSWHNDDGDVGCYRELTDKLHELKRATERAVVNRVVEEFIDVAAPLRHFTDAVNAPLGKLSTFLDIGWHLTLPLALTFYWILSWLKCYLYFHVVESVRLRRYAGTRGTVPRQGGSTRRLQPASCRRGRRGGSGSGT